MSKGFSELTRSREEPAYKKQKRINKAERKDTEKALILMQQGQHEDAEIIYKKLIRKGVKNYVIFGNLAAICHMDNKVEEAAVFSREALRLNPEYPEGLSNLGLALQKQGDRQAAIQLYEKALSIKPDALEALINLSAALKQEGKFQETSLAAGKPCPSTPMTRTPSSIWALPWGRKENLGKPLRATGKACPSTPTDWTLSSIWVVPWRQKGNYKKR